MNEDGIKVPKVIGMGTSEFKPLLEKWRAQNLGVPWSVLLRRGLRNELKPYAGKRLAHLVKQNAA